jgi:hypothetical protein
MPVAPRARSHSTLIAIGLFAIGVLAAFLVTRSYGGDAFWPGLIAGFLGTLIAFVLALNSARERDRARLEQDAESERQRLKREADQLEEQRATEIKRRLAPVRAELQKNAESLGILVEGFDRKEQREALAASVVTEDSVRFLINPQLLEGAWVASAPRLTELIADYQLIADLATAYDRIEELRWRIRYRTAYERTILDSAIRALAVELRDEVNDLLGRVDQQIKTPNVLPLPVLLTQLWPSVDALIARSRIVRGEGSRPTGFSAD